MMQFRLISDVHNEFYNPVAQYSITRMVGDENRVLVIAGDFGSLKGAGDYAATLTNMAKRFKAVVYVPGNHEYYKYKIKRESALREFQKMNPEGLDNIHFLIRDSVVIDGVRFVGATLWTDQNKGNPIVEWELKQKMNDFKLITYHDERTNTYRKLHPADWLREHRNDLGYIKQAVAESHEPVVVVTHHAPSSESLDPRFDWDYYGNFGYYSDLSEYIIDNPKIQYWCHGHIHKRSDYTLGDTIIACNPYGYPGEDDVDFIDNFFYQVY